MEPKIISFQKPEEIFNKVSLPLISESPETLRPIIVDEGGRGSGKSRRIAQALSIWSLKYPLRFALVRKVADTIRNTQFREIQDEVKRWGIESEFEFTTSPLAIKNHRGSEFVAAGLDKNTKIKSLANVDILWIEEAEELTQDDFDTVRLTIRGMARNGQIKRVILSFNRTAGNWTEKRFFDGAGNFVERDDIYHIHTTFLDNKFLDKPFLDELEWLKEHDPDSYQKNALGLPIALKGLIFPNIKVCEDFPDCKRQALGIDFGFNDPNVLVRVGIDGHDLYLDELMYERGRSVRELLDDLSGLLQDHSIKNKLEPIYADSEAPEKIKDIADDHWNVKPADKERGSVQYGIELMKGYRIHITRRSTNIRKDFENYKWLQDKDGRILDKVKPKHAYSHGPDAARYATVMLNREFTLSPNDISQSQMTESLTQQIQGY